MWKRRLDAQLQQGAVTNARVHAANTYVKRNYHGDGQDAKDTIESRPCYVLVDGQDDAPTFQTQTAPTTVFGRQRSEESCV